MYVCVHIYVYILYTYAHKNAKVMYDRDAQVLLKASEKMLGGANSKDMLTEILPFCGLRDGSCRVAQATAIFPKIWTKLVFNEDK